MGQTELTSGRLPRLRRTQTGYDPDHAFHQGQVRAPSRRDPRGPRVDVRALGRLADLHGRLRDEHPGRVGPPAVRGQGRPPRAAALARGRLGRHHARCGGDTPIGGALVLGRVRTDTGFARARGGGSPLYWESTGTGTPVLLIHGLGLSGGAWWRTVDALSPTLRVITFDHRGIGG